MGFRDLLGIVLIAIASVAFVVQSVQVLRGSKPAKTFINEAIHDLAIFFLGLSALVASLQPLRDILIGAAFVALGVSLYRRYWRKRSSSKSQRQSQTEA